MDQETRRGEAEDMIHYRLSLECNECGVIVTYIDAMPPWQEDQERRKRLDTAHDWIAQWRHIATTMNDISPIAPNNDLPIALQQFLSSAPDLVAYRMRALVVDRYYVFNIPTRYVDCPACGGSVFINQHAKNPFDGLAEQAMHEYLSGDTRSIEEVAKDFGIEL